jgi:hypothetical protein
VKSRSRRLPAGNCAALLAVFLDLNRNGYAANPYMIRFFVLFPGWVGLSL